MLDSQILEKIQNDEDYIEKEISTPCDKFSQSLIDFQRSSEANKEKLILDLDLKDYYDEDGAGDLF